MTRHLTRLADIAYRRRGRIVLAWIGAAASTLFVAARLLAAFLYYNCPDAMALDRENDVTRSFPVWRPLAVAVACWAYAVASLVG